MDPKQAAEILRLREAKVAPKQIARKLGLRPAEVNTFIRENSEALMVQRVQSGTLSSIHECLVNQSAAKRLLEGQDLDEGEGVGGFAQILLAREDGNRITVASYLVDYWCLGVKDVVPPETMGTSSYQRFRRIATERFEEPFIEIALEQAQSIIYGAVDYARNLGLEPHRDFDRKAELHLGLRPEQLIPIEFGKDGQPLYFSGPYDDADKIVKTLEANVGKDNFHYVVAVDPLSDELGFLG